MRDHKKNAGLFAVGLGLGAITGILFAPKSGCETRKAIAAAIGDGLAHLTALRRQTGTGTREIVASWTTWLIRGKRPLTGIGAATKTPKGAA